MSIIIKLIFFIVSYSLFQETENLKVEVFIPTAVRVGETVPLQCKYDLKGEPLYTVKWYKGSNEFYRFVPKEEPNKNVFYLPGFNEENIDINKSTENKLILTNVQPEMMGRYKCEVSSDAPNFETEMSSSYMYVIDAPQEDPSIILESNLVDIDEYVRGNCTSMPSFPAANITWLLNGKMVPYRTLRQNEITSDFFPSWRKQFITTSSVEIKITENVFRNGRAILSCVASLFNIYKGEREEILEEAEPRLRKISILEPIGDKSDQEKHRLSKILIILTIILFLSKKIFLTMIHTILGCNNWNSIQIVY